MEFDVRDFGAKFDNQTDDTASIQACIDACRKTGAAEGTIYCPNGEARCHGAIRLPDNWSMFSYSIVGEGIDGCRIYRDTPGDLFVSEDRQPIQHGFDLGFRDVTLGCLPNYSCITLDARQYVNWQYGAGRIRMMMERVGLMCGTGGSTAPAVRIYGGGGCSFRDVWGYGLSGIGGVVFLFERCSRMSLYDCRVKGVPGALAHFIGSAGTQFLSGCRAEGGNGVPEFLFEDQGNITLINCTGEGEKETPAQFLFRRCKDILVTNCVPSTADNDPPGGAPRPDGMRFESCTNGQVIGGASPGSYSAQGAKAIRIDGGCRGIWVNGFRTASPDEVDISPDADDCEAKVIAPSSIEYERSDFQPAFASSLEGPTGKSLRVYVDPGTGLEIYDRSNPMSPILSISKVGPTTMLRPGLNPDGTPMQLRFSSPLGATEWYAKQLSYVFTSTFNVTRYDVKNNRYEFAFRAGLNGTAVNGMPEIPRQLLPPGSSTEAIINVLHNYGISRKE